MNTTHTPDVLASLIVAYYAMGRAGANSDSKHPLRQAWEQAQTAIAQALEAEEAKHLPLGPLGSGPLLPEPAQTLKPLDEDESDFDDEDDSRCEAERQADAAEFDAVDAAESEYRYNARR